MHGVVLQTSGATPLYIASQKGHVECVRTLLDGGAAINQAEVGCTTWSAEYCGGCVCVEMCGRHCACECILLGALVWNPVECVGEEWWCQCGCSSDLIIGCSSHVVGAVLCARCGVTVGWLDTAAHCHQERARGVRAGAGGQGRGYQPGDGGLHNLDDRVLRGLCVCAGMYRLHCACECSLCGALGWHAVVGAGE